MLIRRIRPGHGAALRDLRLASVASDDQAFGISAPQLRALTLDAWEQACAQQCYGPNAIFVAESRDGLQGMVGLRVDVSPKMQHCGQLWGMYVRPSHRGQGIGADLIKHIIAHGREHGLQMLKLSVSASQVAAITLYHGAGFATYATEPAYLCIDGVAIDAIHMQYVYS